MVWQHLPVHVHPVPCNDAGKLFDGYRKAGDGNASYGMAVFFIPFILIATFTVLNLFIAIIVDAMQAMLKQTRDEDAKSIDQSEQHIIGILVHCIRKLTRSGDYSDNELR